MNDRGTAGDLAIVLHSHMPYVEGFGTYPFGEEWLFDAVIRSYLPVLEVARDLTMTVTPVLADQLEDEGTRRRLREFLVEWRIGAAEADLPEVPAECRPACEAELARYRRALELLDAAGGDPLAPFQRAAADGRVALASSAATHAVLPLLATREGLGLQLDAGIRSHRRRFGWDGGLWLPECAYAPGLDWNLAEHGVEWFCVDQSAHGASLDALVPVRTEAGPVALPIDWEAIGWLWSLGGYPSDPAHAQFDGKSLRGIRLWRVGGGAYDPSAAAAAARRQAGEFLAAIAERLAAFAAERERRGLIVFAIDTELLGHWWSEGPVWLEAVLEGAAGAGVRLATAPQAVAEHRAERRPLSASSWGEEKDFRTWDAPPVADLTWGARRLELR
ncbi:MAG: 1,4-alpha-glucan branching protein, partial [Solirubrobacterales bacterium]|nr:1,4-alpha-glucan branching protein [Solirubrobacterales bacterium]